MVNMLEKLLFKKYLILVELEILLEVGVPMVTSRKEAMPVFCVEIRFYAKVKSNLFVTSRVKSTRLSLEMNVELVF
jgi:hypothetical protein